MKDILKDEDIDVAVSHSSSDFDIGTSVDEEKTPDDLATPDALNDSVFGGELNWDSEYQHKKSTYCNRVRRQSGFPTFIPCQRQDVNVLPKRRQSHQGDKLCDVGTVPLVARWPVFLAHGSDVDGEPHWTLLAPSSFAIDRFSLSNSSRSYPTIHCTGRTGGPAQLAYCVHWGQAVQAWPQGHWTIQEGPVTWRWALFRNIYWDGIMWIFWCSASRVAMSTVLCMCLKRGAHINCRHVCIGLLVFL